MLEHAIASYIDGRVRLRHPVLKDRKRAEALAVVLETLPGALSVSFNTRTGSVLLEYDPRQLSREELLALAAEWQDVWSDFAEPKPVRKRTGLCGVNKRTVIRITNRSMAATLAVSMGFALAGRMTGHVAVGSAFLGLSLAHAWLFRKCL